MKKICYFACYWLIYSACQPSTPTAPPTGKPPTATPTDSTATSVRFRLTFVGDIMGHSQQFEAAYDPATKLYDYEICFRYIRPLLEQSDLAIGNLELTLNDKPHYTGYPCFRSPDALAGYLHNAGFDMLVTANNHSNDNRLYGITHTLDVLDSLQVLHTGTFRDSAERRKTYPFLHTITKDKQSIRLAMLNYTYGTNGIPTPKPAVVNLIDTAQILADIQRAQILQPDVLIAVLHWGNEYKLQPNAAQKQLTQWLWRNGVSVVIGAHPHVIQPVELDTATHDDGSPQINYCAYSLGNFVSNQDKPNTDMGLLVNLTFEKNLTTQRVQLVEHDYIPLWRYIHNRQKATNARNFIVVPVSAFEGDTTNFLQFAAQDLRAMQTVAQRIRTHLRKWDSQERLLQWDEIIQPHTLRPSESPQTPANAEG